MMTATGISARAVNTLEWLSSPDFTLAVPIYQRHYRWTADDCARLLEDVRLVATESRRSHFIGSVLATSGGLGEVDELMLIDGQQRVSTLTLLIAALRRTIGDGHAVTSRELGAALLHPADPTRTRLRPHRDRAAVLSNIVLGTSVGQEELDTSRFDENYSFFLAEVNRDPWAVLAGLKRLEHIAITLGPETDPQQVFESVNSTGAPLRNHELIHNHVHIGLTHSQQSQIEDDVWIPIEVSTGDAIDDFWRDLLILHTGKDADLIGQHGTYDLFRKTFPPSDLATLKRRAEDWKSYAARYAVLLDPRLEDDPDIRRQLTHAHTFGRAMFPFLLGAYQDHVKGGLDKADLIDVVQQTETLYLRKMVVGQSRDHLAAQLCRRRQEGAGQLVRDIARKCPSDARVRNALAFGSVPHVGHVLARLNSDCGLAELADRVGAALEIEHIFPAGAGPSWTGVEGGTPWTLMDPGERARHVELLQTLGNLTLLEQPLNGAAGNKSFPAKLSYYAKSQVAMVAALTKLDHWDPETIAARTAKLTADFLTIWSVPTVDLDEEGLTPILDVARRAGYFKGWKTEYDYVRFGEEVWEIRNAAELYDRVFTLLWTTHREQVLAWNADERGPIFRSEEWVGRWRPLDEQYHLFRGQVPQYKLGNLQGVLQAVGLAEQVAVKLSTEEA